MSNANPNEEGNDSSASLPPNIQVRHNRRTYVVDLCKIGAGGVFLCVPFALIYLVQWYVSDISWAASVMQIAFTFYSFAVVLIVGIAISHYFSIKDAQTFDESVSAIFGFGGMNCIFLLVLASIVAMILKWAFLLFNMLFQITL